MAGPRIAASTSLLRIKANPVGTRSSGRSQTAKCFSFLPVAFISAISHFAFRPRPRSAASCFFMSAHRRYLFHDPSTVVEIEIPTILPLDQFERVQQWLVRNNPRLTPPRIVNGPTLLAGLAVCACCGHGMTRTGTQLSGRAYQSANWTPSLSRT